MSLVPWDLDCRDCGYPLWYGQTCPRCGWSEDEGWDDQQDDDDDLEEVTMERGTRAALAAVEIERHRQTVKWGTQRHAFPVWVTVLTEETGEFA